MFSVLCTIFSKTFVIKCPVFHTPFQQNQVWTNLIYSMLACGPPHSQVSFCKGCNHHPKAARQSVKQQSLMIQIFTFAWTYLSHISSLSHTRHSCRLLPQVDVNNYMLFRLYFCRCERALLGYLQRSSYALWLFSFPLFSYFIQLRLWSHKVQSLYLPL